jgi:hypothetical protein
MPPTVPINHVLRSAPPTESSNRSPVSSFHAQPYSRPQRACLEHSDLLTGTCPSRNAKTLRQEVSHPDQHLREGGCGTGVQEGRPEGVNDQAILKKNRGRRHNGGALGNLTTSFLSAAKLIYAIGAGVTAAAGRFYCVFFAKKENTHHSPRS